MAGTPPRQHAHPDPGRWGLYPHPSVKFKGGEEPGEKLRAIKATETLRNLPDSEKCNDIPDKHMWPLEP